MEKEWIQFKTIVPKQGELKSYINAPFMDRANDDPFNSKIIGVVTKAIEVENGYELTVSLFGEYRFEWDQNDHLCTISFDLKSTKTVQS